MAKRTSGGVPVEDDDQPAGIHHPVAGESNARAVRHPTKTGEGVAVSQLPQRDARQQQEAPAASEAAQEVAPASTANEAPPKPRAPRKRTVGKHKS